MKAGSYFTCDECEKLTPDDEVHNPLVGKAQVLAQHGGVEVARAVKVCGVCAKLQKYAQ
jgi:hypothetical protein